jgi:hypothetical protein
MISKNPIIKSTNDFKTNLRDNLDFAGFLRKIKVIIINQKKSKTPQPIKKA